MIISNDNLSAEGFTITPNFFGAGVLPLHGNDNLKKELLEYSPKAEIIGGIPDLGAFHEDPDINVYGMKLKSAKSNLIIVPKELSPFFSTIRACVNNEWSVDPNAFNREFVLTITRTDTIVGQPHRLTEGAGDWHVHIPSKWIERAEKMPVNRIYSATNFCGTECYVGNRSLFLNFMQNNQPLPEEMIQSIPEGKIGIFTSYTLHRSPAPLAIGRRTVFLFGSRPSSTEEDVHGNPMSARLYGVDDGTKILTLNNWRTAEAALTKKFQPLLPDRMPEPKGIDLAA